MRKFSQIILAAAVLLAGLPAVFAQSTTTTISAQKLVNIDKTPLNGTVVVTLTNGSNTPVTYTPQGGSPSTATFTATVVNGAIQPSGGFPFTVPAAATTTPSGIVYRIQTINASSVTVWTLPLTNLLNVTYFSLDGYIAQAGVPVTGTGPPTIPHCSAGAQYTDTTATAVPYACSTITSPDNTTVWTQNPSQNPMCSQAIAYPFTLNPYCIPSTAAYLLPGYSIGNSGSTPAAPTAAQLAGGSVNLAAGIVKGTGTGGTNSAATASDIAATLTPATGCSTTGYVYSPQSNTCVSAGGGGSLPSGQAQQIPAYLSAGTTVTPIYPTQSNSPVLPATAGTLPVPAGQIQTSGYTAQTADGDSVTVGTAFGCTISADCYPQVINTYAGSPTLTNYGVSGNQACDAVAHVFNTENLGASSTTLQTDMIGINDANFKTVGAYEGVFQLCHQAMLSWQSIPSTYKVQGGAVTPATNWSTDTTYSITGIQSTTNAAAQTFTYTTTAVGQTLAVWYMIKDGNGGQATLTDSGTSVVTPINFFTTPTIATHNGATQSIGVIYLPSTTRPISSGTATITVTVTSATSAGNIVSVYAVGTVPPAGSGNSLWVGGVIRQAAETPAIAQKTATYNDDAYNDVLYDQQLGLPVYWVNPRNCLFSTAGEMATAALYPIHPNNLGQQEIGACFIAATGFLPQPQVVDNSVFAPSYSRLVTTCPALGFDQLTQNDTSVLYSMGSTSCNFALPPNPNTQSASIKHVFVTNYGTGTLTYQAGTGITLLGTPTVVVQPNITAEFQQQFFGSGATTWSFLGYSQSNPLLLKGTTSGSTALTLSCTGQVYLDNAASTVYTLPTTCPVGTSFWVKNFGTTAHTFTGASSGDANAVVLQPNDSALLFSQSATAWYVLSINRAAQYNCTTTTTFATTPSFGTPKCSVLRMVLTGNVTSSTISAGQDGQRVCFDLAQDATGSRTFVFPTTWHGAFTIGTTASKDNVQCAVYSSANAYWLADSLGVTNE